MNWLLDLYQTNYTAQAIAVIALVCMGGMVLGSVKLRGIGLGTAGVLFAGIVVGHLSKPIDHKTLEFTKEFGLVLFVFCLGSQLGPGFFASFRRMGMRLNLLAGAIVVLGALLAVGLGWLLSIDSAAVLGLFSGATTNTPSLGAAQQTLSEMPGVAEDRLALPALAYAVTYPGAIVGIIGTLLALKWLLRIDPRAEAESFAAEQRSSIEPLVQRTLQIDNSNLDGLAIASVPGAAELGVVVSRIKRSGAAEVSVVTGESVLHCGDLILAVGTERNLDQYQRVVGRASTEDLLNALGALTQRGVVVTNRSVIGKTVRQLALEHLRGATVTRVARGDLELTAVPDLQLQFGDVLQVVGDEESLKIAADRLGDSLQALNETHFVPLFAGIVVGIALGTMPVAIPNMPQPLRLGLAGGPLIVALLVGRLGRLGPLVWHMPRNANLAFREFGIALFFASVGLMAGPQFFELVFSTRGLLWLAAGSCVTVLPLVAVGVVARLGMGMNFALLSGLLAGSMTDPPALAFANNVCGSETPSVAYAAVYPLTTLMRILAIQILAVALFG
jgi:putative transport protein